MDEMVRVSFNRFARLMTLIAATMLIGVVAACSARPGEVASSFTLSPDASANAPRATDVTAKLAETDQETLSRFKFTPDRLYLVSPAEAVPGVPFFCSVGTGVDFERWCPSPRRPFSSATDTWLLNPANFFETDDPPFIVISVDGRQYRILSVKEPQEGHWFLAGLGRNQASTSFRVSESANFVMTFKGGGPGDIVFVALKKRPLKSAFGSILVEPLVDPDERNKIVSAIMTFLGATTPEQQAQFSPVFTEVEKTQCNSGFLERRRCTLQ